MTAETDPKINPVAQAYDQAKRFAKEGAYAEALEQHQWLHAHALEHDPAWYGVRLSFALGTWRALGDKYPPALESLHGIRDQNTARLYDGDPSDELFHDVVALNRTLGDNEATFLLFRHFETIDPELARRRFYRLSDVAFEHEPELFMRYTPDLERYFDEVSHLHRSLRQSFARLMALSGAQHLKLQAVRETRVRGMKDNYWRSVEKLAGMARTRGQVDLADRLCERGEAVMREED